MSSASDKNGTAIITIYFKPGTDPDVAQVQVQNKVQLAHAAACRPPCSSRAFVVAKCDAQLRDVHRRSTHR